MDEAKRLDYIKGDKIGVARAAQILGCSRSSVLRKIHRGELLGHRPGDRKLLLYKRQVVELAARKHAEAIRYADAMQAQLELFLG